MSSSHSIICSAPGSLMLLGEHAVLHGNQALVCAIDRRIRVTLTPLASDAIEICSDLGTHETTIAAMTPHRSFTFVMHAIASYQSQLHSGFRLTIESEFSADIGFGSSAAVTVATHGALLRWISGTAPDKNSLFERCLETVHAVQGRGSGADLAAAVFGGVVGYTTAPQFDAVAVDLPLTAVYCGYKTPTPEVIERVERARALDPEKYASIYAQMNASAAEGIAFLKQGNWAEFGAVLNHNQLLMEQMDLATCELAEIVSAMQSEPAVFGAKISGSGLGDCAVAVGEADLAGLDYPIYRLAITSEGCTCHE